MAKTEIKLFGSLGKKAGFRSASGQTHKDRVRIEFEAPDLTFTVDENAVAGTMAKVIASAIRDSLLTGRRPDGVPLPQSPTATVQRREYRDAQAANGGKAPSLRRPKKIRRSVRSYNRRFRAPRLGAFDPRSKPNDKAGVESGMTANSVAVAAEGGKWNVYFANARGIPDRSGQAPVERMVRAIGGMDALWNDRAMQQPGVQVGLKAVAENLVVDRSKKATDAGKKLLQELNKSIQGIQGIADTATEPTGE